MTRILPIALMLLPQIQHQNRVAWGFNGGPSHPHLPAGWEYRMEDGREMKFGAKHWIIDNSLWSIQEGYISIHVIQEPGEPIPRSLYLITREAYGFGLYQARIRFQQDTGANLACWGQSIPGAWPEIDFVEGYGRWKDQDRVSQGFYSGGYQSIGGEQWTSRMDTELTAKDWHLYGCSYREKETILYIDGVETKRVTGFPGPVQPIWVLLSGSAGAWNGIPDPAVGIHARMDVDWITIDLYEEPDVAFYTSSGGDHEWRRRSRSQQYIEATGHSESVWEVYPGHDPDHHPASSPGPGHQSEGPPGQFPG